MMPESNVQTIRRIEAEPGASFWRDAWRRLRKNKLALFGLAVVVVFSALSFL